MSFHLDSFTYLDVPAQPALPQQGLWQATPPRQDVTFKSGDVIRVLPEGSPYGNAVILGFAPDGECKLSRPYAYASGVGTTGPTVLLGAETYTMTANNMRHLATCDVKRGDRFVT